MEAAAALGKAPPTFAIRPKTSRHFLSTGLSGVPLLFLLPDVSSWQNDNPKQHTSTFKSQLELCERERDTHTHTHREREQERKCPD